VSLEQDVWRLEGTVAILKRELGTAHVRIGRLETEVRELRAMVTALDPGALPAHGDPPKEGA